MYMCTHNTFFEARVILQLRLTSTYRIKNQGKGEIVMGLAITRSVNDLRPQEKQNSCT